MRFLCLVILLAGCQCPQPAAVVSLANIVNGVQTTYTRLAQKNVIQPDMQMKISERHLNFLRSDFVARQALVSSVAGNQDTYQQAFAIAVQSANEYVLLLLPYLSPMDSIAVQQSLKFANAP